MKGHHLLTESISTIKQSCPCPLKGNSDLNWLIIFVAAEVCDSIMLIVILLITQLQHYNKELIEKIDSIPPKFPYRGDRGLTSSKKTVAQKTKPYLSPSAIHNFPPARFAANAFVVRHNLPTGLHHLPAHQYHYVQNNG